MNAGRSTLSIFKLGRHSLDDPVMVAWDAIQRGEPAATVDSADAALIARFLASDRTTMPSSAFVDRLRAAARGPRRPRTGNHRLPLNHPARGGFPRIRAS